MFLRNVLACHPVCGCVLFLHKALQGEIGDRRENRSTSAPDKIWFLMLLDTGGGCKERAFGGIGRGGGRLTLGMVCGCES